MRAPLVLMYHGVDERAADEDPDNLFVRPQELAAQLGSLLHAGWTPVGMDDYLARRWPRRGFLVTFDDGYRSVGQIAAPILAELGIPGTCFVCPGRLGASSDWSSGRPEPLLDADGVRALPGAGIEVGAHGWDHTAMPGLPAEALRRHTREAGDAIADVVGRRPRSFAYPYGSHDAASRQAVAAAGYAVGYAVHDAAGAMAVPRVDVNALDTPRSFRMKTLRIYPQARRVLARTPAVRAHVHDFVGKARGGDDHR